MFNFGEQELSEYLDELNKAKNQSQLSRDYKCPKCDGEFNNWVVEREIGKYRESCPFCGAIKGRYTEEESAEQEPGDEFGQEMSDDEIVEKLVEAFFGMPDSKVDEDQTDLQDLLEREYISPEQERGER